MFWIFFRPIDAWVVDFRFVLLHYAMFVGLVCYRGALVLPVRRYIFPLRSRKHPLALLGAAKNEQKLKRAVIFVDIIFTVTRLKTTTRPQTIF